MNVVELKPQVDEECVRLLRLALKSAKEGQVTGLAMVVERPDGGVATFQHFNNGYASLGAITYLANNMSRVMMDGAVSGDQTLDDRDE